MSAVMTLEILKHLFCFFFAYSFLYSQNLDLYILIAKLKKGEKIQLVGFGTFEVSERAAREGRNPQTGEAMTIAASKTPKFKAGKALKDSIN